MPSRIWRTLYRRIGQAKRYARDITLTSDELPGGGPWQDGDNRFRVPFLFATNGRPYVNLSSLREIRPA